jgi:predicted Zn-dependent peptidase
MHINFHNGTMKKGAITLFLLLWFLSFATFSEAGLGGQVYEKVLPNGLKVLLLENHKAPVITFQTWYRVGSCTSQDFTAYFENLGAGRVHISPELESDRMQNLVLREEDFHTEQMVVMEERRLRTADNPQAYLQPEDYVLVVVATLEEARMKGSENPGRAEAWSG